MADDNKRQQLLDFLDQRAFDPVLNASPDQYDSENLKHKLADVKSTTRSTKKRYHESYTTAEDVYNNFISDLSSDAADKVQADLRDLDLPTLDSIKKEFERKAHELGVH